MVSCGCHKFMEKILMRFSMNIVKPVNIPLSLHCNISQVYVVDV
jgi:hypothetical protein